MVLHRGWLLRVLVVLLLIGCGVVGMSWWQQRQLIYFPDASPVPPAGEVIEGARDVTLHTDDGLELGAWFLPAAPGPGATDFRMAVLVAPGNGGNRADRAGLAGELRRRGLAVLLMDYRGYGGNPGSPSEAGLALDAMAAVQALVSCLSSSFTSGCDGATMRYGAFYWAGAAARRGPGDAAELDAVLVGAGGFVDAGEGRAGRRGW